MWRLRRKLLWGDSDLGLTSPVDFDITADTVPKAPDPRFLIRVCLWSTESLIAEEFPPIVEMSGNCSRGLDELQGCLGRSVRLRDSDCGDVAKPYATSWW